MEPLRYQLLLTLSFLEPMNLEMIFLDLDKEFTLDNPDITMDIVLTELKQMEKEKLLNREKKEGHIYWIKNGPKSSSSSLWRRVLKLFQF